MNSEKISAGRRPTTRKAAVTEQTRLRISHDTVFQSLGKDHDTVLMSLSDGYLYTCNETTTRFLEAMDGRKTLGELTLELQQIYDIESAKLLVDLQAIAGRLLAEGLITITEPDDTQTP